MVVEYIRYNLPAEKAKAFHAAYRQKAFRASPEFAIFFQAVKPFFENIEEMKHYSISDVTARK